MEIVPSFYFSKKYKKLIKKHPQLSDKIDNKLEALKASPGQPSLRLHKLTGSSSDVWSILVTQDLRILFQYTPTGILLNNIGTHDEVY